jgi:hypothetical protein
VQRKFTNGTRLHNLHKKKDLFARSADKPRYTPQSIDVSLEAIRQKVLTFRPKKRRR